MLLRIAAACTATVGKGNAKAASATGLLFLGNHLCWKLWAGEEEAGGRSAAVQQQEHDATEAERALHASLCGNNIYQRNNAVRTQKSRMCARGRPHETAALLSQLPGGARGATAASFLGLVVKSGGARCEEEATAHSAFSHKKSNRNVNTREVNFLSLQDLPLLLTVG